MQALVVGFAGNIKMITMKKIIFLLLFIPLVSFGQGDIGKTKNQIMAKYSVSPCENEGRALMYCSSDGSMIGYVFNSYNRAESIQFWTAHYSQYKAEIELEKAIESFAIEMNDTPTTRGGMTSFNIKNSNLGCTFSTIKYNGTYYVRQIYQVF